MKISKLFHWLYGLVMLLPIFALLVPCLIAIFNKNSLGTDTLYEVFYNSLDEVVNSSLFSWSYSSFLVAPFNYIVNLFSMPINSPVVMLLSYWLAISIIWLVFDLIMYVPLLVHRWLDKGVLE